MISIFLHGFLLIVGWLLFGRLKTLPLSKKLNFSERVSVIIPARNEEFRLPRLLQSIRAGSMIPFEVIVVNDHSEDKTESVARSLGAWVINCDEAPADWIGKTWACHQGAMAAHGDILVFLDADTFLEQDGLQNIASFFAGQAGALSIQPYHEIQKPYEALSAFFNVVQCISSGAFTILGDGNKHKRLLGPCFAIRSKDYFSIGGHESVKHQVLENFHLSEKLWNVQIQIHCMLGNGSLRYRMYQDGLMDLIRGWSKAFSKGAAQSSLYLLLGTIGWFTGAIGTARHLATAMILEPSSSIAILIVFYLLYVSQIRWILKRIGNFGFFTALFFPVGMMFFLAVFLYSLSGVLLNRRAMWKGRRT